MILTPEQQAELKERLLIQQNYICPICELNMYYIESRNRVLDHDHKTGCVRAVICRNCNGREGEIHQRATRAKRKLSAVQWLTRLVGYYRHFDNNPREEQMVNRPKKRRKKRYGI